MKKVLIIDDDDSILEALQIAVEMGGYEVKSTSSADSIIKLCEKFKPDLIISDLLLSGVDGRQLIQELQGQTSTKKIPIILLSAHPEGNKIAQTYNVTAFLAKPFEISELLSLISQYTS